MTIAKIRVFPAFHYQLSSLRGCFSINSRVAQAMEMVVAKPGIYDVKCLFSTFNSFPDEG
jgi:hypothetical protein